MGRGTLNKFGAAVHQNYLCMKMPGPAGVITVCGDQDAERRIDYGHSPHSDAKMIHAVGNHEANEAKAPAGVRPARAEAEGGTHAVAVDPAHLEPVFQIGDSLSLEAEAVIIKVLQDNMDMFAWSPAY
ncbi:hypothetical protein E2562_013093 [Oryza meyeriana var. granulata]|uniref:Uncharacterized protein n=1 Tax=Oryza meyeriana var. granulata TaxID=110450 RepID=A0A6G1F7R2_9ORYZ|nr:hypothetical protein E2562_013093 [Oryza meyeriana var. granulata]